MIAATATQGVMITAIVAAAAVIVTTIVSWFSRSAQVIKARQQVKDDALAADAERRRAEKRFQLDYERTEHNLRWDQQRQELEQLEQRRRLGLPEVSDAKSEVRKEKG